MHSSKSAARAGEWVRALRASATEKDVRVWRRFPVAWHARALKSDRADAALMLAYSALSRSWRL